MTKPTTYRIEKRKISGDDQGYYVVRDVRVRGRNGKVSMYLGKELPTPAQFDELLRKNLVALESKAAEKKGELSSTQYVMGHLDESTGRELISKMEWLKYLWLALKNLLKEDEIRAYEENFELQYIQGSTSIEGNTLTLNEARLLLEEGIVPQGKSLREINEVQNFKQVKKYRDSLQGKLTLEMVKGFHARIMHNIDVESAGEFRRIDSIGIRGRDFQVTPSIEIENELQEIIDDYYSKIDMGHYPLFEAMVFHHKFELIHPFTDGNGRVGRELLNYLLSMGRYPRLLFLGRDRPQYLGALMKADEGDYAGYIIELCKLMVQQRQGTALKSLDDISCSKFKKNINVPDSVIEESGSEEWKRYLKEIRA